MKGGGGGEKEEIGMKNKRMNEGKKMMEEKVEHEDNLEVSKGTTDVANNDLEKLKFHEFRRKSNNNNHKLNNNINHKLNYHTNNHNYHNNNYLIFNKSFHNPPTNTIPPNKVNNVNNAFNKLQKPSSQLNKTIYTSPITSSNRTLHKSHIKPYNKALYKARNTAPNKDFVGGSNKCEDEVRRVDWGMYEVEESFLKGLNCPLLVEVLKRCCFHSFMISHCPRR